MLLSGMRVCLIDRCHFEVQDGSDCQLEIEKCLSNKSVTIKVEITGETVIDCFTWFCLVYDTRMPLDIFEYSSR
jgi:hypothetical protein